MFGAAKRSSVGRTGPSSSNLVRAAAERVAAGVLTTAGENASAELVRLALRIRGSPSGGTGSALAGKNLSRVGRLPVLSPARVRPQYEAVKLFCNASFLALALENFTNSGQLTRAWGPQHGPLAFGKLAISA